MKTLQMTLTVSYSPNGVPVRCLRERLQQMVRDALRSGLLTGMSPAIVQRYTAEIVTVKNKQRKPLDKSPNN